MQVSIYANMCDGETTRIDDVIREPLEVLSRELSNDYGGSMEHLWIHFELIERHALLRPPYKFRLQKKVGGTKHKLTGLQTPVYEKVGHYSVRPDFQVLRSTPLGSVTGYVLSVIYASTAILIEKQKKLGGFDARRFRSDFLVSCQRHGYTLL